MNLKENIFTNFATNKLETVVNSKKIVILKNIIVNGILAEGINWNTLMRIISKRQNSKNFIKLPLKAINIVVFKYFYGFS